jgi:hypothetical protein
VCGLDSRKVKVDGIINILTTYLNAYPHIAFLMDVVVIDLPLTYGMLLSQKWPDSMGGSIQMDLSYTLIPNVEGQLVVLHREPFYLKHVEEIYD